MNMDTNREREIIGMIKGELIKFSEKLEGYKVVLFGSRAAKNPKERSDFDIGIIGDKKYPVKLFYELDDKLQDLETLYEIDLVDLNSVSERFRNEALKNVFVLYE